MSVSFTNDPAPSDDIVLDLSQDFTPDTFTRDQLVHRDSVIKLENLVRAALPSLENTTSAASGFGKVHNNQTFFIDGTRGAGKSTFLNAIANYLASAQLKLYRLPTIDPTMLEAGEQSIFFSILFHLKNAVEDTQVKGHGWGAENREYEDWRKVFQKLARGANLLNHDAGSHQVLDDLLSMDEGVANARSGLQLKQTFHELLAKTAAILNVNGFIIAFDDVDTHFDKGWEVLELIRRYLQSPHLFVLITGDLQLYTHLVRSRQFKHLGRELHEQDSGRAKERGELVDHLEQQYLMKLFPLQNRVHLAPLGVLLNEAKSNAQKPRFFVQNPQQRSELSDYVDKMVRTGFLLRGKAQIAQLRDFLLHLPLRAVMQIFRQQHSDASGTYPSKMAQALRGTLMGSMYKLGVDVDALAQGHQGKLIEAVFDAVVRDGELNTGIYLRPQPSDESLRNVYVALSAEVAAQCMDAPDKAIRYLLLGPGSITLLQRHMPTDGIANFIERFKKEMSIGRQENALNWARYAAANLLSVYDDGRGTGPGVLKLNLGRSSTTKYTFDDLLKDPSLHPVQQIAFRVATHQVEGNSRLRLYMSVFNLLGAMENMLLLYDDMRHNKLVRPQLRHQLSKLGSRLTVTAPSWIARPNARISADSIENDDADVEPSSLLSAQESEDYFHWWLGLLIDTRLHFRPSAFLLGKVWTRLYFSLVKIASLKLSTGHQMHMNVLCLINAFLVEEYDQLTGNNEVKVLFSALDRNNPVASADQFFDKLIALQVKYENPDPFHSMTIADWIHYFPFTMLVLRCPLILAFLIVKKPPDKIMKWFENVIFTNQPSLPFGTSPDARNTFLVQLQDGMEKLNRVGVVSRDGAERVGEDDDRSATNLTINGPGAAVTIVSKQSNNQPEPQKRIRRTKEEVAASRALKNKEKPQSEVTPPTPPAETDLQEAIQTTELEGLTYPKT
jgi:hypothetical protein